MIDFSMISKTPLLKQGRLHF